MKISKENIQKGAVKTTTSTAVALNAILATTTSIRIDRWLGEIFNGPATPFDKAMDTAYNTLKKYGADHRLFDGSHDLSGAWKAITKHAPEQDQWIHKAEGYVKALWKDVVTPKGLPVVTWDKEAFDQVAGFMERSFGISRSWTKDMVTFTGTELIGATIGSIAIVLAWKQDDLQKFSDVVASLGLSAIIGANPIMTIVTIIGLARCFQKAMKNEESLKQALSGGGKGIASTGAMIAATSLIPGPVWISIMLGIISYALARYLYGKAESNHLELNQTIWKWSKEFTLTLVGIPEKSVAWSKPKLVAATQKTITTYASETADLITHTWPKNVWNQMSLKSTTMSNLRLIRASPSMP